MPVLYLSAPARGIVDARHPLPDAFNRYFEGSAAVPKKYTFLAFTNPVEGKEDEFNQWYDEHHVIDVLNVPGHVSARRFRLSPTQFQFNTVTPTHRYLALYDIETDDIQGTLQEIVNRAGGADMVMIDAIDMSTLSAPVYEEITPTILAKDVLRPRRA
jgi:hypothetical protein